MIDKALHISNKAYKKLPVELQVFLWHIFKEHAQKAPPYLHKYVLTKGVSPDGEPVQKVRYCPISGHVDYTIPSAAPVKAEVFILCGGQSYNMGLLSEWRRVCPDSEL